MLPGSLFLLRLVVKVLSLVIRISRSIRTLASQRAGGPNPGEISQALEARGFITEGEPRGGDSLIEGCGIGIDPITQGSLPHFPPKHFGRIQFR